MKPTILFILHLPPPVHGAAMMGKYIHDSKLINQSFDCHYINLTTAKNLEDIGHFRLGKIDEFVKLLHRIRKSIHKLHPDLVYVTPNAKGGAFYKDFVVVEMIKSMGCKVVVHYHNKGVATRQDRWLDDKLYRKFFKGIKVILLAEALYPDVKKYVKREDVYICPNGIPDTTHGEEPTAERHNKIPHLLFLSNLLVSKGVLVLLDALKILKDRGYSFVCDFVGGETKEIDAARFQREVEARGLNRLLVYDGKKYGEDKEKYFNNADVFVFPTYYSGETFGLVNLEAMEHKVPVVTTNEGGIPDVVKEGQNGLISEKGNSQSLADCVAQLLDDEQLREKMGEDGYKKFKEHFTLQAFEAKFKDCIGDATKLGGVLINFVYYYGRKYGIDKVRFYQTADIFVAPSFDEAFPLVNLEAMQFALPVVATNVGGVTEEIDDGVNGFMAKAGDSATLADNLAGLMSDGDLRKRMGEAGYRKFESRFTLSAFESRFAGFLSDCVGGVIVNVITYYGKKFGDDKEKFFNDADIFVFPTYYPNECFPLVLLEAMQHGLPCISTREGGIPDIIQDGRTGLLVERRNSEDLAEKIAWMINHPRKRKSMGEKGAAKFKDDFTIASFEHRIVLILANYNA